MLAKIYGSLAILGENLDKMGVAFGKTNKNFEDFRSYYEANVILPFEKSGVVRVTSKGSGGSKEAPSYWLSDEQVASSFFRRYKYGSPVCKFIC